MITDTDNLQQTCWRNRKWQRGSVHFRQFLVVLDSGLTEWEEFQTTEILVALIQWLRKTIDRVIAIHIILRHVQYSRASQCRRAFVENRATLIQKFEQHGCTQQALSSRGWWRFVIYIKCPFFGAMLTITFAKNMEQFSVHLDWAACQVAPPTLCSKLNNLWNMKSAVLSHLQIVNQALKIWHTSQRLLTWFEAGLCRKMKHV